MIGEKKYIMIRGASMCQELIISVPGNQYRFSWRVNILGGSEEDLLNSGVGKSEFYSYLENLNVNGKLSSSHKVVFLNSITNLADVTEEYCLFLDEANYNPKQLNSLFETVKRVNCFWIVIGRLFVNQFSYAPDAVYSVKKSGNTFLLENVFNTSERTSFCSDEFFCEDSTAVAFVYSTALGKNVVPVNGKDRFWKFIKNSQCPFLIVDAAKFGAPLLELIYRCSCESKHVLNVFAPECFEQVLLDIIGQKKDFDNSVVDSENWYEGLAKDSLSFWNKQSVAKSVNELILRYDIMESQLIQDLVRFSNKESAQNSEFFYVINCSEIVSKYKIKEQIELSNVF